MKAARGLSAPTARIAGIAGNNTGTGVPGPAIKASLDGPSYVAFGTHGSLYLIESAKSRLLRIHDGNITVAYTAGRNDGPIGGLAVGPTGKVVLLTHVGLLEITGDGRSSTIATLAQLGEAVSPGSQSPMTFDRAGNLYIANSSRYKVLRRTPAGVMSVFAGNGVFAVGPPTGDGGPATSAPMVATTALAADAIGNVFIGQTDGAIRKVAADGKLSTVAGAGNTSLANGDGTFAPDGSNASDLDFVTINAIVIDSKGRMYVGDSQSSAIVRINLDATITFVGGDQGNLKEPTDTPRPANETRIADANNLAFDSVGALFVVEAGMVLRLENVAKS